MATNTALTKQTTTSPEPAQDVNVFVPRVDISESADAVLLVVDMPGVDETTVSVDLEGSELTLRGAFRPTPPDGYTLSYREYEDGNYERTFTLGDTIDRGGIKAVVKDGVLRLTLPKAREAKPRRIAVKAG